MHNKEQFAAYLGIEIGMSLMVQFNDIKSDWSDGAYVGHNAYKDKMPRTMFQNVCANSALHNPDLYNHERTSLDPLWHSCSLMEHFMKSFALTAVPLGTSELDENTIRTKLRTSTRQTPRWGYSETS